MRDYWLVQYILAAVGWGYLIAVLIATALALKLPKSKQAKVFATVIVIGLSAILPLKGYQGYRKEQQEAQAYKARLEKAQALFAERCKTAGEKIYRTVEGVEGVLLLNVRPEQSAASRGDPLWADAALPDEASGDDYIRTFLYWEHNPQPRNDRGYLNPSASHAESNGYKFVEVRQADESLLRYTLSTPDQPTLSKVAITKPSARYAISFENQIDPQDRQQWIAGTTITVTDTQTGETIAQRQSYAFEPGLGNTSSFRSPWGFAVTCPSFKGWGSARTRFFVDQILKPSK